MKNYLLKELNDPASKSTGYQKIAMIIYLKGSHPRVF